MIKDIVKAITPTRFHSPLNETIKKFQIIGFFWRDVKHLFLKNSNKESRFYLLRSRIIKNYHRLEKSLSTPNFQPGRGLRAAEDLISSLENYQNEKFDISDMQIKVALSVLKKFLDKQNTSADYLNIKLEKLKKAFNLSADDFENFGGVNEFQLDYFISNNERNFSMMSSRRHSVRDYSNLEVDPNLIKQAVQLAQRTPSVCNRQGWHVFSVTNPEIIKLFKKIHNGFSRKDQFLSTLLVVCFSKSSFSYPLERHQGYTDGGLFSMSLMYALTHLGLATCPLNANITKDAEKKLRSIMDLSDEFGIVMFIAVGHYKKLTVVPVSHRDQAHQKITFKT